MGAFYRLGDDGALMVAKEGLATPTGQYAVENHGAYSYPIDGQWRYFETETAALNHFSAPDPMAVPAQVSMMQARRALLAAGLLDAVNSAVAQADAETQVTWEYATTVRRQSPFVETLAPALGLTSQQVDDLFRAAVLIE